MALDAVESVSALMRRNAIVLLVNVNAGMEVLVLRTKVSLRDFCLHSIDY